MKLLASSLSLLLAGAVALAQPAPSVTTTTPAPAAHDGFIAGASVAASLRGLFGVAIGGSNVALSIGVEGPNGAFSVDAEGFLGATEHGLLATHIRLGVSGEAIVGRLRVGGGARPGAFFYRRGTNGAWVGTPSFGMDLRGSYDLFVWQGREARRSSIYVCARAGADLIAAGGIDVPFIFFSDLALGARY